MRRFILTVWNRITSIRPPGIPCILLAVLACGAPDAPGDSPPTARAPESGGEVWTIDRADDRATAPGAVLAYLHGLHSIVLDGNTVYAGMTRYRTERDADGNRSLALAGDLTATFVPDNDLLQLRFSTGDAVTLRQKEAK